MGDVGPWCSRRASRPLLPTVKRLNTGSIRRKTRLRVDTPHLVAMEREGCHIMLWKAKLSSGLSCKRGKRGEHRLPIDRIASWSFQQELFTRLWNQFEL